MSILWIFAIIGVFLGMLTLGILIFFNMKSWNIPVVIFKVVGDKRRPMLDLTKRAKVISNNGIKKLKIRGTPMLWEYKNFKSENYYPTVHGRGALVLLEFAKDCYTPMRPSLIKRMFGKDTDPEELQVLRDQPIFVPVGMDIGDGEMQQLLLKAVDDFDPDFIIRNFGRIDTQYTGGWRQFLKEFGWIIGWVLLFCMALVGIVLFFQKAPELAAACAKAGVDMGKNIVERTAANIPTG